MNLDIMGQMPVNIYTQICLVFPLADSSSDSTIVATLRAGLEKVSKNFPWVAGQVVRDGVTAGNTGHATINVYKDIPQLVVKDFRDNPAAPTLDALRRGNYPMALLDESLVAPRNTVPSGSEPEECPVLLVQATFITGGLLLTFVAHHCAMDFIGQAVVMELLSKACRDEPFTTEELRIGNIDRGDIVPLLEGYHPGPEVAHQLVKPVLAPTMSTEILAPPPPAKCVWANFNFSAEALEALKKRGNKHLHGGFVSTDDALSALIWQSVTKARIPRFRESHPSNVKFARAVDTRSVLGIPTTYTGWMQNMTYHHYPPHRLAKERIGTVASELRAALEPKELRFRAQASATVLANTADKTKFSVTASLDPANDIMLSSWSKVDCYSRMDFNLGLGKPLAARRPRFVPVESLIYLGPKAPDGAVVASICLQEEDMGRLSADEEFAKYATFVG